jgi:hypothetical protein
MMKPLLLEPPPISQLAQQLASLAPHDPARYQATDGLYETDYTNGLRAEQAFSALRFFARENHYPENEDNVIPDLICNLLHHAHARGHELEAVLSSALGSFLAEAGEIKKKSF